MARRSEAERFLSHVDQRGADECWPWKAYTMPNGYGQFRYPGRHELAHRVAYRIFVGALDSALDVMHRCDNRSCVNPHHLSQGTRTENMRDAKRKGRHAFGERHGSARLSASDVAAIRASNELQRELAARFGITQGTVSSIRAGKRWSGATGLGGAR